MNGDGHIKLALSAIVALFVVVYVLPLGIRPMVTPDEGRYAEIPREMCSTGDWVVPRLNGLRYFEKPAGGYWMTAGSMMVFGENTFAMRLPSALAAGISALIVFLLVRRSTKDDTTSLFAAAALLTSIQFFAIGVYNVLDGPFSMLITLAMALFFVAYGSTDVRKRGLFLVLFGAACGAAFLVKGFLGFAIPGVIIVPFLAWERRWKDMLTLPWLPLAGALAIALPWCIAIHLREPDYWHYFFWVEHIERFISPAVSAQHKEPFWYFLPVIIAGALPWAAIFPAATTGLIAERKPSMLTKYCLCWLLCSFLFLSGSSGKLGTYILPCFPPLMILTAVGLRRYMKDGRTLAMRIGLCSLAAVVAILGVGLAVAQILDVGTMKFYTADETLKWICAAAAILSWALITLVAAFLRNPGSRLCAACLAPVAVFLSVHFVIPNRSMEGRPHADLLPPGTVVHKDNVLNPGRYKEGKGPGYFLRKHMDRVDADVLVVSDSHLVSAICWFYKRTDVSILNSGGELSYGLAYQDSSHRLLSLEALRATILKAQPSGRVILITNNKHYAHYRTVLPPARFEDIHGGFVFAEY